MLILTTSGQDLGFGLRVTFLESYSPLELFSLFSSHCLLQSKAFSRLLIDLEA